MLHISYDEYAALPGLRWSTLKHMRDSPLHLQHALNNPRPDTTDLQILRAIHASVLEGVQDYVVYAGSRRGKVWTTFKDAHPGLVILRESEHERVVATTKAVHAHKGAASILSAGLPEVSIQWEGQKGRLDWLDPERGIIADLKTLGTTDPRAVARMVAQYGYHGQMAHYEAAARAMGVDVRRRYLIVAEGNGAHDVAVFDLDDATMRAGHLLRDRLLEQYRESEASGVWPGRLPEIEPFALPGWAAEEVVDHA